jgi:HEAT repeat protein
LYPLLFSPEEQVRREVRATIQHIAKEDAPAVVGQILDVLKDDSRQKDHLDAIRALAAIGPHAAPAVAQLRELLASEEPSTRFAAAVALERILGEREFNLVLGQVLGDELGVTVTREGVISWPGRGVYGEFDRTADEERKRLFP